MNGILIDVSRLVGRLLKGRIPTGVDRVGLAYVKHYGPKARAVLSVSGSSMVCRPRESQAVFDWLLAMGCSGTPWRTIWRALLPGGRDRSEAGSIFLNTGHTNLHRRCYIDMLRARDVKPLFLIHDLIPITHPQFCREGEQVRHQARMQHALTAGSGIICNSQATLDVLTDYCTRIGRRMPPAIAAPLASDLTAGDGGPRPVPEPYFVVLSTIEPRKNHLMILQVWQRLIERLGEKAPRLILVGQRGWECEHVARLLERSEQLQPFVLEKNRCTDEELVTLLRHAQALLFPSFAEGYGLPVIEALTHGVPVIASSLPVFREFAGDIPAYVDPLDAMGWAQLIESYADGESPDRMSQLSRMTTFKAPTWSYHFRKVDELIARVAYFEPVHA